MPIFGDWSPNLASTSILGSFFFSLISIEGFFFIVLFGDSNQMVSFFNEFWCQFLEIGDQIWL